MLRYGGAVTLMQQNIDRLRDEKQACLENIIYLLGSQEIIREMNSIAARQPFDEETLNYLNDVSKILLSDSEAKAYADIITFAFWIRKSSLTKLKERFMYEDGNIHMGRGVAFHIAPSNVPINYAYSLVTGLITGNANIVRVPSKEYDQIEIITRAFQSVLDLEKYVELRRYICLVRYDRNREINDWISAIADVRIIWGGDETIAEIRKSPLNPRACEVTFADRFSLAVVDSDWYLTQNDKDKIAEGFYNDTYLMDQNACTSPRIIIWMGNQKEKAKEEFWGIFHKLVMKKYTFQPIQGINKLTSGYLLAAVSEGVKIVKREDNLIVRVKISKLSKTIMDLKDNSGYFFEYDCENIMDLRELCNDRRCQTVAYLGDGTIFTPLLLSGIKGIDRIMPIGKTLDFDVIWDGYNLYERLTRIISVGY